MISTNSLSLDGRGKGEGDDQAGFFNEPVQIFLANSIASYEKNRST